MPLFDYQCRNCGHVAELLVKSGDQKVVCPECGSPKMERQLAAFAVGSGDAPAADCPTCCGADSPCSTRPCDGGTCTRA